jgi:hypothetical protein
MCSCGAGGGICSPSGMCGFCPCATTGRLPTASMGPTGPVSMNAHPMGQIKSIPEGQSCGCSPGFNMYTIRPFNYNSQYGYHGVGYEMLNQTFCDGIGGCFSPSRPSSLCLGCGNGPN